ncbi:MAG: MltA domain-containing protein [Nitrospinae bacterium]|nr:MltA domain-containing protein [Nitrospinota bacterium]
MKLRLSKGILSLIIILSIITQTGCAVKRKGETVSPRKAMKQVGYFGRPDFKDSLDKFPLLEAIKRNYDYLGRLPPERMISYGEREYTVTQVIESFQLFEKILTEAKDEAELKKLVTENFDIFESTGNDRQKNVLFTGYYEPIMKGSLKKDSKYRYPIYSLPDDLVKVDLGKFNQSLAGRSIVARIANNKISPYHTRGEIDKGVQLSGKGFEMAWLEDRLDLFFLHIQGSGIIETDSGKILNVNYAGNNGKDYKSIGRLLINNGDVPKEEMSMKAIREYLNKHPEKMDEVLNHNESYVFFRQVEKGPIGSIGVPLTPKRSIATDTKIFPKGSLAYIETEIPITDKDGNIENWEAFSAFVVDQDTGGAIKGAGRVDIFFGSGDKAGHTAGSMNRNGKLYYLIKKDAEKR